MNKPPIQIGEKYGKLTVVAEAGKRHGKIRLLLCSCQCGGQKVCVAGRLRAGQIKTCGCSGRGHGNGNPNLKPLTIHGESAKATRAPEYVSWCHLIDRCENPNNHAFENYGGRGIGVCERWRASYRDFLDDMGRKPSKIHSMDRIDVNGNYEPDNCRWATPTQQSNNTRKQLHRGVD